MIKKFNEWCNETAPISTVAAGNQDILEWIRSSNENLIDFSTLFVSVFSLRSSLSNQEDYYTDPEGNMLSEYTIANAKDEVMNSLKCGEQGISSKSEIDLYFPEYLDEQGMEATDKFDPCALLVGNEDYDVLSHLSVSNDDIPTELSGIITWFVGRFKDINDAYGWGLDEDEEEYQYYVQKYNYYKTSFINDYCRLSGLDKMNPAIQFVADAINKA